MKQTSVWILGGTAALVIAGALYAVPVFAAGSLSATASSTASRPATPIVLKSAGTPSVTATSDSDDDQDNWDDMGQMHSLMFPLMNLMPAIHTQMMGDVAQALGMSVDDLSKALASGQSLTDLATAKKVEIGSIRAIMLKDMQAFLDQAVAQKEITKDQEGQILGFMTENIEYCLNGSMGWGMMGNYGGRYGMMGGYGRGNNGRGNGMMGFGY